MRHGILLAVLLVLGAAGQVPDHVRLVVSSEKIDYYLGETVRLQLRFTSTEPNGFTANPNIYDRMGWHSVGDENGPEDFVVDPQEGTEDPIKGIFSQGPINVRCCAPPVVLSERPFTIERILNAWVRFRRPGTYRLYVVSHRVGRKSGPEQAAAPILLSPNSLALVFHAAPAAWIKEQIAATTKVLDLPVTNPPKDSDARERAMQQLRFLNTPESAVELARRVDRRNYGDDWVLMDSSYRPQELAVLEGRLVAPDEACDGYLLDGLAHLAQLISLGGMGWKVPKREPARKAWQQEFQRRVVFRENKIRDYASRLYAALPSKESAARAECSLAVLNTAMNRPGRPEWLGSVTAEVRADFRRLRPNEQVRLLQEGWTILRSPAMLPILRSLRETMPDLALPRVYELAPEEGRRLIIDEIRHSQHRIAFNTLAMLPDRTLPELDDVLAAEYEQGLDNADMLILRYARGAVARRVKETYRKRPEGRIPWAGPVVYYLLKYDPKFGEQELRRSLATPGRYTLRPVDYEPRAGTPGDRIPVELEGTGEDGRGADPGDVRVRPREAAPVDCHGGASRQVERTREGTGLSAGARGSGTRSGTCDSAGES
jgi:hypothetical protein